MQVDPEAEAALPLLEVKLELEGTDIKWAPLLEDPAGVRGMLESWLADMQGVGSLVQQLYTGEGAQHRRRGAFLGSHTGQAVHCLTRTPQETTAQRLPRTQP